MDARNGEELGVSQGEVLNECEERSPEDNRVRDYVTVRRRRVPIVQAELANDDITDAVPELPTVIRVCENNNIIPESDGEDENATVVQHLVPNLEKEVMCLPKEKVTLPQLTFIGKTWQKNGRLIRFEDLEKDQLRSLLSKCVAAETGTLRAIYLRATPIWWIEEIEFGACNKKLNTDSTKLMAEMIRTLVTSCYIYYDQEEKLEIRSGDKVETVPKNTEVYGEPTVPQGNSAMQGWLIGMNTIVILLVLIICCLIYKNLNEPCI